MPFLFLVYVLSYLDRVNIGYAKLQFGADLGFSDRVYGLGAGIFFIGYLCFEVPSNVMLNRFGARVTISRIMILWGALSTGMMFIHSSTSFYLMRFLLGVAEAGLVPGVILYLTYWFPADMRARMIAIFMAAIPVSGIIGAPLSGFVMRTFNGTHELRGWQWMFLLEGIPSVLVGIWAYFYLDNRPKDARWLSAEERSLVAIRVDAQVQVPHGMSNGIGAAVRSRVFWLLTFIYLFLIVGNAGFSFWLPQIVMDLGVTDLVTNGLVTAIPYLVAGIGMIAVGYSSDRRGECRWHYAMGSVAGALGLFVCAFFAHSLVVAVAGLALSYLGILSCFGVFWSSATSILKSEAAVVGIALINSISSVPSYISPFVLGIIRDATHHISGGLYLIALCLLIGGFLALRLPRMRV
ncbi:MFS transporter [Paraburkholderia caffeinilytica]|nr:MFS transporter [Paraburkholderia caffeinilytica]